MFNHARGLWGYTGLADDGEPLSIQSTGHGRAERRDRVRGADRARRAAPGPDRHLRRAARRPRAGHPAGARARRCRRTAPAPRSAPTGPWRREPRARRAAGGGRRHAGDGGLPRTSSTTAARGSGGLAAPGRRRRGDGGGHALPAGRAARGGGGRGARRDRRAGPGRVARARSRRSSRRSACAWGARATRRSGLADGQALLRPRHRRMVRVDRGAQGGHVAGDLVEPALDRPPGGRPTPSARARSSTRSIASSMPSRRCESDRSRRVTRSMSAAEGRLSAPIAAS